MRSKLFQTTILIVFSMALIPATLSASAHSTFVGQSSSDDSKYAGTWVGSFTTADGNSEHLSYILRKNSNGQWGGTVKFTNEGGEQSAEFSTLQIADGKMKGKLTSPNGDVEVTLDGQFKGDQIEGNYSVSPVGSTDVVESGTWKVARSAAAKNGN